MIQRASTSALRRGRVLTALALAFTTLVAGCDMLDLARDWSPSDDYCTNVPGHPCQPPPPQ
jgi:hypothetical protein